MTLDGWLRICAVSVAAGILAPDPAKAALAALLLSAVVWSIKP
jgi:hypothetical protein